MEKKPLVKTYTKYYVKRSIDGRIAKKNEDGSPVLGDVHKGNIRITPAQAGELNYGWDSREKPLSFYYKEDEVKDKKSEKRIELESKANELEIKFRADISDEKLEEKINEKQK